MSFGKTGLILIDVQKGFQDPIWGPRNNPDLEKNISLLLHRWRERGAPIFHIQHLSKDLGSPLHPERSGVEFMEVASPFDEPVFKKSVNSAFIGTNLEQTLREKGVHHLVFVGLTTDHCVSTSVRMAANLGFQATVVSDGVATFDRQGADGDTFPADLVHAVSLASLNREFARIVSTNEALLF